MMTRKIHKAIIASLLIGLPFTSFAKRYDVTLPEVASCLKTAQPGDQIYIKDGQYKDMQLKWTGNRESFYQDRSLESWKSKD